MSYLQNDEIRNLQRDVNAWVTRNFDNSELTAVVGLVEEVGELCRAVVKMEQGIRGTRDEWSQEIRKETGDIFIKLCDVARFYEFDLSDAVRERWADVSQRNWKANPIGHGIQDELPPMPSTGTCLVKDCPGSYDAWGRCTTCGDVD
jgi:NTP pyrophosphatase (non-canonical NTP hydrolase)